MKIQKAPETMSARERVQKTFAHEKTDRVTIGYETNTEIHKKLSEALGIHDYNLEMVFQALGVDYRPVNAPYKGPAIFEECPGKMLDPVEGFYMEYVAHDSGGYWEVSDFPLMGADDEIIANYPVPDPGDFDVEGLAGLFDYYKDYSVHLGGPGTADVINSCGRIMGMEDILCHLVTENPAVLHYIDRRQQMQLAVLERTLDRYKDKIDFLWMGEDLGTQNSPMISLDLYRKVLRPRHQKFVDLAKAYNLPVMVHTCGSSSWVYEDFIDMGITGVDTLQPEAKDMSPRYLKEKFGNRLTYRGCISTAALAVTTPEQVTELCKETMSIMMEGYGYHFAPTHQLQDNTPVENVIAMYQAAHDFGRYL